MTKIPYEQIAPEVDRLAIKMVMSKTISEAKYWHEAYIDLLKAAGWDPVAFDQEMLKRIDAGWDEEPIIWN